MVRAEGSLTGGIDIRPAQLGDLDAAYRICLQTGDSGSDASPLYRDPELIGHIYAGPYLALDGFISLVAEDGEGICGYAVGAADTREYERRLEAEWWPGLRGKYREPAGDRSQWTADDHRVYSIFHPPAVPQQIVEAYPAHIHLNLLPRAQGRGAGTMLLESWIETARRAGVKAVHAGVGAANSSGLKFWTARGFARVFVDWSAGSRGTVWCGRFL